MFVGASDKVLSSWKDIRKNKINFNYTILITLHLNYNKDLNYFTLVRNVIGKRILGILGFRQPRRCFTWPLSMII